MVEACSEPPKAESNHQKEEQEVSNLLKKEEANNNHLKEAISHHREEATNLHHQVVEISQSSQARAEIQTQEVIIHTHTHLILTHLSHLHRSTQTNQLTVRRAIDATEPSSALVSAVFHSWTTREISNTTRMASQ